MICNWGIGLSEEHCALLQSTLGEEHQLLQPVPGAYADTPALFEQEPFIIWMSSSRCRELDALPPALADRLQDVPKIVLLESGYTLADFEAACDCGATEIVRPPLTRERIAEIVRRSLEHYAAEYDIDCMAREIMLERELLERKNELLGFLVNFLTNTTESLDITYLLQNAFSGLDKLLPLKAMHAALWDHPADGNSALRLHISAPHESPAYEEWRQTLLEHARPVIGGHFSVDKLNQLTLPDQPEKYRSALPSDGTLLSLPIVCGDERLGVLLLLSSIDRHLGRDQAMALDSAMRHFALTLKNARRFMLMQMYADYDSLTKVHSRRHFESRIVEESERVTRYGQPLSLLMVDIDHFKNINDTHGHHVGDTVLREVASIIAAAIRSTDYCARYGGEEFVVLLPHTRAKKAFALAERIRKKIDAHIFLMEGGAPLSLSASFGVSCMSGDSIKNRQSLLCEADAALYAAKENGRNRTCMAGEPQTKVTRLAG